MIVQLSFEEIDVFRVRLSLSKCNKFLWWKDPGTRQAKSLQLSDARFVRVGQVTPTFRMAKNVRQFEAWSFSLILGGPHCTETLDLIAHRQEDFGTWVSGLRMLVAGADECQRTMQNGIAMSVVKAKGLRQHTLFLSSGMTSITWVPCSHASTTTTNGTGTKDDRQNNKKQKNRKNRKNKQNSENRNNRKNSSWVMWRVEHKTRKRQRRRLQRRRFRRWSPNWSKKRNKTPRSHTGWMNCHFKLRQCRRRCGQ